MPRDYHGTLSWTYENYDDMDVCVEFEIPFVAVPYVPATYNDPPEGGEVLFEGMPKAVSIGSQHTPQVAPNELQAARWAAWLSIRLEHERGFFERLGELAREEAAEAYRERHVR